MAAFAARWAIDSTPELIAPAPSTDEEPLTPLHPNHVKALRLSSAFTAVPVGIAALVGEGLGLLPTGSVLVPVLAFLAWYVLRLPLRRHRVRGYHLGDDRLRVVKGLLIRRDTVVPFGRVQHIDVERGPIERLFGLATLILHTAGTHNASVSLAGLGEGDALVMREAIRAKIRRDVL